MVTRVRSPPAPGSDRDASRAYNRLTYRRAPTSGWLDIRGSAVVCERAHQGRNVTPFFSYQDLVEVEEFFLRGELSDKNSCLITWNSLIPQ